MTKKKKASSILAMTLAAGTMFSVPVYGHAAQQNDVHPSEKQEWAKNADTKKHNGQTQQFQSIDQQLVKIEETLGAYKQEIDALNLETPAVKDGGQEQSAPEGMETHEEYKNKLTALENRLIAVNNRLDSLTVNGADTTEIEQRQQKVEVLQVELNTIVQTIIGEVQEEPGDRPDSEDNMETVSQTPRADSEEDRTSGETINHRLDELENRVGELERQAAPQNSQEATL